MMPEPTSRQIKIIMKCFAPKGWKIIQREQKNGCACPIRRAITVPIVKDRYTLGYFLHECAHVYLKHVMIENRNIQNPPGSNFLWHKVEAEAEIWSLLALKACGFPASRAYVRQAKDYVKTYIETDRKWKRPIDPEVLAWANSRSMTL